MARSVPGCFVARKPTRTIAELFSCSTTSPQLIPADVRAADGKDVSKSPGSPAALSCPITELNTLSAFDSGSCETTPFESKYAPQPLLSG